MISAGLATKSGSWLSNRTPLPVEVQRVRQWLTVRGIVAKMRAIARLDKSSAAISTIRARKTCRYSTRRRSKPSLEIHTLVQGPSRTSLSIRKQAS